MADAPATASKGGKGLTRKVGPLPVWGWAVAGFGIYYWYTHFGPGKSSATAGKATPPGGRSITVGNITLTQSGRGRGGGGGRDVDRTGDRDKTGGDKDKTGHCPDGFFWDKDDNDGKGGCVKIKGHKGPDKPGSDNATTRGGAQRRGPGTGGPPTRQPRDIDKTSQQRDQDRANAIAGGGRSQTVMIGGAPTGGPVNAQTGQPVFEEWQHAHRGPQVPPPVEAFAPGTSGAVYGPAAVDLAAQSAG